MVDRKPILIVVSVEPEKQAVLQGLGNSSAYEVLVGGVGIAQAAARTARQLAQKHYQGTINMGIAGGFPGKAANGSVAVATSIIAPEIGAESPEGFLTIDALGFGTQTLPAVANDSYIGKLQEAVSVATGTILSVMTVTGTEATLNVRQSYGKDVVAEAMEGFGVASAAAEFGLPFAEVRSISNQVGIRDKASWEFASAFSSLTKAAEKLKEVEQHGDCLFTMSK